VVPKDGAERRNQEEEEERKKYHNKLAEAIQNMQFGVKFGKLNEII